MTSPLHAAVRGLGAAVPEKVLANADFEKFLDTSDAWIMQRTGIRERRVVADGQSTSSLGLQAAQEALADAGIEPGELDLIICATITPEMIFPATACFIQQGLGATGIPAFDISAACSGFVYGLAAANGFIASGQYKNVLVVGSETLTRFCDYEDRGSCVLFGDGAGAAMLSATDDPDRGLRYFRLGADGSGWDFIHVPAGGSRLPASRQTVDDRMHYIKMRGRDVYKFAVEKMRFLLRDAMEACQLTVDDVDLVVPHQVNLRIIESAATKLHFPMEKVYVNINRFGNTSAASIPVAMAEAKRTGRLADDATVLMVAFGAGLTWAGGVLKF